MPDQPIDQTTFATYLDLIAAKTPTPGGGAVACSVGAMSVALASMVVNYSVGKKSAAAHEPALQSALIKLKRARDMYLELGDEDAAAYGLVNELQKLPQGDPRRTTDLPGALKTAADVPLATMALSVDILRMYEELAPITNIHLRSDLGIAAVLAEAANRSSAWNVAINIPSLPQTDGTSAREQFLKFLEVGNAISRRIELACRGT